ncbi:MAG TPA: hypothetical protein VF158_05970 [Longimicrobiales bacterium]
MELILACACDDATVRPDGKLDISGIFNELSAPGFPAMQDRMTVVFIVEWGPEETGRLPLRADLVDEANRPVLTIQGHTEVEARGSDRARPQTRLIMPLEDVVFPAAGRYHFELKVGEQTRRAFSLFVGRSAGAEPHGSRPMGPGITGR